MTVFKHRLGAAVLSVTLLFAGCAAPAEQPVSSAAAVPEATPAPLPTLTAEHVAYLGNADDTARPEEPLTRGEIAQWVYALLEDPDRVEPGWTVDVPPDHPAAPGAGVLVGLGLLDVGEHHLFFPEHNVTRGEFVTILGFFLPPDGESCEFSDLPEDAELYPLAAAAVRREWLSLGEDGAFRPEAPVTRAEAVHGLNTALGRHADLERLAALGSPQVFADLPVSHAAYGDMLEAYLPHTGTVESDTERWSDCTVPPAVHGAGPVLLDGELYLLGEDGTFARSTAQGVLQFGADGRYTTGDPELDTLLTAIVGRYTDPQAEPIENLERLFQYASFSFEYINRGYQDDGATGWENGSAKEMLTTGGGNCYNYAAVFALLARKLGYQAHAVSGTAQLSPNATYVAHSWVEIDTDAGRRVCDPEAQGVYNVNHQVGYYMFMRVYGSEGDPEYYLGDTYLDDTQPQEAPG